MTNNSKNRDTQLSKPHHARPTIGFLNTELQYEWALWPWQAMLDAAMAHQVNLVSLIGHRIARPQDFDEQANVLYALANARRLDGLIIWQAGLVALLSKQESDAFCRRFGLPVVTIEGDVPGMPCVTHGSYDGIQRLMAHLIEVHGYRRIGFVGMLQHQAGFEERYQAYSDTLRAYGLAEEPDLTQRWFPEEAVADAGVIEETLFHAYLRRALAAGVEALVGVADSIAFQLLTSLRALNVRVPHDVAVVGFDGFTKGRVMTPPLTTVDPGWYQLGYQAMTTIVRLLAGEPVPPRFTVPAQVILRQSCGCADATITQAARQLAAPTSLPADRRRDDAALLARDMLHAMAGEGLDRLAGAVESLIRAFQRELVGESAGRFLLELESLIRASMEAGKEVSAWHDALSVLREQTAPAFTDPDVGARAENLWHQARVLIGKSAVRAEMSRRLHAEQQASQLRDIEQALLTTFDVAGIMDVLAGKLPLIGIPRCYLATFDQPQTYHYPAPAPEWARLRLAYDERGCIALPPEGLRFPSWQFTPPETLPAETPFHLIAQALYFMADQIGFVLFAPGPRDGGIYDALCGQISSALQGALLVAELVHYREHLEHLVEERTVELTRSNAQLAEEVIQRMQIEQALRVSEEQYRLLAENVKDGIIIVQNEKLVFGNAGFAAMTGYPPEYLITIDPIRLFHHRAAQIAHDYLTHPDYKFPIPRWQAEILTKDGRTIWTEIEQTGIVWNSQPALLLTIRDITDRKLREKHLEEERIRFEAENLSLKSSIRERYRFGAMVGKSQAMQRVYELIVSAATSDVNVIIAGESGTGKELIAQTLHQISRRKAHTFVPVNCASIPETLFEREFFGHRKGAFTGADRDTPGLFDKAHHGTLFLDEVTELSPATQAKLLRVLQDGEYTPLGGTTLKRADVLIVAATNKDCQEEIRQGRLRKDFFYRIGVIEIHVPSLRERKDDLPLLIEYVLEQYREKQAQVQGNLPRDLPNNQTMLPSELVQALYTYDWPGNVRELQNVLQRYLATRDSEAILALLGQTAHPANFANVPIDSHGQPLPQIMETLEKRILAEVLAQNNYRTGKTARQLGINQRTLQKKIKRYQLTKHE